MVGKNSSSTTPLHWRLFVPNFPKYAALAWNTSRGMATAQESKDMLLQYKLLAGQSATSITKEMKVGISTS